MKTYRWMWMMVLAVLCGACQVAAGIAPLDVGGTGGTKMDELPVITGGVGGSMPEGGGGDGGNAGIPPLPSAGCGGGSGGAGGACGMPEPPCEKDEDAECSWLNECGCGKADHCQALGADAKATCNKKGPRKLGETCKGPDDCKEGTCEQHVCRAYCEDRCEGGKCLPATGADNKPLPGVNVCWKSCQIGNSDSCVSGTTCQTREVAGTKAAFCLPPADPCPTVEDGKCDEPDLCAAGTDSVDCSCKKKEGVECDPVANCGCAKGKSCSLDLKGKAVCEMRGMLKEHELCQKNSDCAGGMACIGSPFGTCRRYCAAEPDCNGKGACSQVTNSDGSDIPGYKVCRLSCGDAMSCPEHHTCYAGSTGGPFCLAYLPEIEGAECSLTLQLGCETKSDTRCVPLLVDDKRFNAGCRAATGTLPVNSSCSAANDCQAGALCVAGICRSFCDLKRGYGCDTGACRAVYANDVESPFGTCYPSCTTNAECGAGRQCELLDAKSSARACKVVPVVPLTTTCPTNNGRCDEPQGTGLCAAGYDTAECMGMTP